MDFTGAVLHSCSHHVAPKLNPQLPSSHLRLSLSDSNCTRKRHIEQLRRCIFDVIDASIAALMGHISAASAPARAPGPASSPHASMSQDCFADRACACVH
eukprot:320759-Pelagomonas_calceolata.AAC.1